MPKKQPTVPKDPPPLVVNILSVAGYGFDNRTSQIIYIREEIKRKDKLRSLQTAVAKVFHKIIKCVVDHKFKYVHIPGFDGAFAQLFYSGAWIYMKVYGIKNLKKLKHF